VHDTTDGTATLPPSDLEEVFSFEAIDVTGMRQLHARDVQRRLPAGAAARSVAEQLSLPDNVPWSFLSADGEFLDDQKPIGEQIQPGAMVTVVPKTHLG
jgi:hypothetical protein